jgi:hypothetical protein
MQQLLHLLGVPSVVSDRTSALSAALALSLSQPLHTQPPML